MRSAPSSRAEQDVFACISLTRAALAGIPRLRLKPTGRTPVLVPLYSGTTKYRVTKTQSQRPSPEKSAPARQKDRDKPPVSRERGKPTARGPTTDAFGENPGMKTTTRGGAKHDASMTLRRVAFKRQREPPQICPLAHTRISVPGIWSTNPGEGLAPAVSTGPGPAARITVEKAEYLSQMLIGLSRNDDRMRLTTVAIGAYGGSRRVR
jgi:hypothetical protein